MISKKNIIDKIWEAHVVHREKGAPDIFFIDLQFLHEVTSPQAFNILREKNLKVKFPERNFATIDHSIPTKKDRTDFYDAENKAQVEQIRKNCKEFGVTIFDVEKGQGIVHVIGPELGLTQPGRTIVCGDSHTSTHGAFGALAFGIGTTQISHVLATQALLLEKPKTMKVIFVGVPSEYFTAKDAALLLIAQIGIQGANGYAVEFCGKFVQNLSMEARMTLCNLSIEAGARFGVISPDETTVEYLKNRKYSPYKMTNVERGSSNEEVEMTNGECQMANESFAIRTSNFDIRTWLSWASDENAEYDQIITVDLTDKMPMVTWGTNPEQGIQITENIPTLESFSDPAKRLAAEKSLEYIGLKPGTPIAGTPVDFVFIGSCTNSRIEDMREAAKILKGKKVSDQVTVYIVPGSEAVRAQCIAEGLDKIFEDSGADFRMSGCSMCLAMNGDFVPPGKRCASTSNRNFVGRQGPGSFTHLMNPRMAAMVAITGKISEKIKEN